MTNFDEVINYSFYIFEHNFLEFEKAIDSYTNELYSQGVQAFDTRIRDIQSQKFQEVQKETARLLHNYLASWFSLKEQTHAAENSFKKSFTNPFARSETAFFCCAVTLFSDITLRRNT